MANYLKSIIACAVLMTTSCSVFDDSNIWDHIHDLESRVNRLEELCKEMNTNMSSIQALVKAVENRDFVTHVAPVHKDGKTIGYTISFANSGSITIYHGNDAVTPVIGVKQATDGIFYWTIDNEWLTDSEGNRIQANAKDGETGNTPLLKVEDGYWHISYDLGVSWTLLGKATGEQGEKGDSMFINVDTSNPGFVVFTMSDGSQITIPTAESAVV